MRGERDWIQTFSGGFIFPLDPRPEEIKIEDIAHHLAMMPRFSGATKESYSVAQHSVLVSEHVPAEDALCGLLHDASESYLGDLARPIKHNSALGPYRVAEDRIMACVAQRFGLPAEIPDSVHVADNEAMATERRDLLAKGNRPWGECVTDIRTWPEVIVPLSWQMAEAMFMHRFFELTGPRSSRPLPWVAAEADVLRVDLAAANARADSYLATLHEMQAGLRELRAKCVQDVRVAAFSLGIVPFIRLGRHGCPK